MTLLHHSYSTNGVRPSLPDRSMKVKATACAAILTFAAFAFEARVPARIVTPGEGRTMHHFFDKSPISPSGRIVALLRIPYEDRRAQPGDAAEVVLVDLETRKERTVAKTCAGSRSLCGLTPPRVRGARIPAARSAFRRTGGRRLATIS